MNNTMVYDSRLKREYYTLMSDHDTVEFLPYEWVSEWGCYAPDGRGQYTFKLSVEGWKSWNDFCEHLRKFGYLTLEEQKQKGTAR